MFDDIRRVGEKIDGLLGSNIFPFNYPISHTENFLRQLEKWEFSIPLNFMWLVHIEEIPSMVTTEYMHNLEPTAGEQSSGAIDSPGAYHTGWDIDRGKIEITRDEFMKAAGGVGGCILAQGVNIPGETYSVEDVAIENNMGFLPGKVGGNRAGMPNLTIEFRETNRSFTDLVIRPWMILASHMGMVARPNNDFRKIKTNIQVIQLAKTFQYTPTVERKVYTFYNCVPTSISSTSLTQENAPKFDMYDTQWAYTHYNVTSLPNDDMGQYMKKQGFKQFVKKMAVKILSRSSAYKKLQKNLRKVERFVDKAQKIKNKINKFLGPGRSSDPMQGPSREMAGRSGDGRFVSD